MRVLWKCVSWGCLGNLAVKEEEGVKCPPPEGSLGLGVRSGLDPLEQWPG